MLLDDFYSVCGGKERYNTFDNQIPEIYISQVPDEINELWKTLGAGSCMDNYLWIINPADFEAILSEIYIPFIRPSIPFARSAFGDLFVWENLSIKIINVRFHYSEIIGKNPSVFFNKMATDWEYFSERVRATHYVEASKTLGFISKTECYGYVPLLAAGGSEKLENIKIVKMKEHLSITAQLVGRIDL